MCTAFFAFFALVSAVSWAQSHQEAVLELAGRQSFAKLFIKNETPALPCLPQLSNELPAPGPLSLGLDEWVNDPAIDSKWVSRFFANDCSVYKAAGVTADLYVPLIEQLLTEKGLNLEYAWLPVALSGMNPHYEDLNRAGLWAFDRLNARISGLRVTRFIDERKSPAQATNAAVVLLALLDQRYPNDPVRVAIAFRFGMAYADRCEPGTGDQALIDYLACLKVGMRLLQHTDRNGSAAAWVQFLTGFEEVELTDTLRFDAVQSVLGMEAETLAALHPWFTNHVLLPDDRLPVVLSKTAALAFEALSDSAYAFIPAKKEVTPASSIAETAATTYKVRSGDVLGAIARRFGVRVSDLMAWNNLRSDRINVGQVLTIFAREAAVLAQEVPKPAPMEDSPMAQGQSLEYTVKEGDSLWLIARKYPGVSADDIMEWNSIGASIRPGMKLIIYLP